MTKVVWRFQVLYTGHFDVPSHDRSELESFWRRLRWLAIGLLAPELLLYIAWNQLVCAVKVLDVAQTTGFAKVPETSRSTCWETIVMTIREWKIAVLKWAVMPSVGLSDMYSREASKGNSISQVR